MTIIAKPFVTLNFDIFVRVSGILRASGDLISKLTIRLIFLLQVMKVAYQFTAVFKKVYN